MSINGAGTAAWGSAWLLSTSFACFSTIKSTWLRRWAEVFRIAILVPMADECVTSIEPVGSPHPAAFAVEGKVILVIADAPTVQEGTGGLLGKWGYSVLTAGSDEAALIRLADRQQRPDLIISDYHLASGKTGSGNSNNLMRRLVHQFQLFSSAAIRHLNHYVTPRIEDTFCCTSPSTQCGSVLSCTTSLWIMTMGETPGRPYQLQTSRRA